MGGLGAQAGFLIILILITLLFFIILALIFNISLYGSTDNLGNLQGVIYHFLVPSSLTQEIGNSSAVQIFTVIISLFGMVLMGGLLISTISNIIRRRVQRVENGQVYYKSIENHYIIIGYNGLTMCLIQDIIRWERNTGTKDLPDIIIFTDQEVSGLREVLYSRLPSNVRRHIFPYSGNINSLEHLRMLNVERAKEIFILGDEGEYGRDSDNIACVKKIAMLRGGFSAGAAKSSGKNKEILKVNIQIDSLSSYSTLQKIDIPPDYFSSGQNGPDIYFRPFSFYENWARLLWGFNKMPKFSELDFEPMCDNDKHVHLVIVGFNLMGRALLLEALRICHYPNFNEDNPLKPSNATKITIVDSRMDELKPQFETQYPYLNQITDVEINYISSAVESAEVRKLIDRGARDENELMTIAICLSDQDISLTTGLSLPESVYYKIVKGKIESNDVQILIRQESGEGLGDILDRNEKRYKNVKMFGSLSEGMRMELLDDVAPKWINAYYDMKYPPTESAKQPIYQEYIKYLSCKGFAKDMSILDLALSDQENKMVACEFANRLWLLTSEDFRFSNRYQTEMYGSYMKYGGYDRLFVLEHRRWCAERSIIGYRDTHTELSDFKDVTVFKCHKCIVPFKDLTENDKGKDMDVISNMDKILKIIEK